jgi:hypothetical protein
MKPVIDSRQIATPQCDGGSVPLLTCRLVEEHTKTYRDPQPNL